MEIDWKKLRKLIGDQILLEREEALVKHIADEAERKSKEHRLELDVYLDECQAGTAGGADPIEELANGRGVPMAEAKPQDTGAPGVTCAFCKHWSKGVCKMMNACTASTSPTCYKFDGVEITEVVPPEAQPARANREPVKFHTCAECRFWMNAKDGIGDCDKLEGRKGEMDGACGFFEPIGHECSNCVHWTRNTDGNTRWGVCGVRDNGAFESDGCPVFAQREAPKAGREAPKADPKQRYCGSCKFCKQSPKDPDVVECTRTRTDFFPIVRWSAACQDFEEASREMA